MKNDVRDAADLADLLRMGRLPEAWIAPPPVRELRELVRHRAKLVVAALRVQGRVHAVLAKQAACAGHRPVRPARARRARDSTAGSGLPRAGERLLRLIDTLDTEIGLATGGRRPAGHRPRLSGDPGHPGIGPVWAAVFVAEIGDVTRFASARHLCSWAGLTPRHRESDTTVHRGAITKMGSTLVRWAAVEAVQRIPGHPPGWSRPDRRSPRAATSPRSPSPASCSPWSTTAYGITICAACPRMRRRGGL